MASSAASTEVDFDLFKRFLPQILAAMPDSWRGTTFKNNQLLGRAGFAVKLKALLAAKANSEDGGISTADLDAVGNAEDYLRVSTNISTTLEIGLGLQRGYDVTQVFTFASSVMPIVAVLLTSSVPVHLYVGAAKEPFTAAHLETLRLLGADLTVHSGPPSAHEGAVVLAFEEALEEASKVDGIVGSSVLFIANPEAIDEAKILVIRKRMATPFTTPMAEAKLQELAGLPVTANTAEASPEAIAEFHAHLQTLSGTEVNADVRPVVFTAGLPSLCSLWVSLVTKGGADILMCSTAYGGSSQLMDLMNKASGLINKHRFHIQGTASIVKGIQTALDELAADPSKLLPRTVLFVEIPTNPDMKVPDMPTIVEMLKKYKATTGKEVLLLIDSTFAPGSRVLDTLKKLSEELAVIVFISLSKSVSRGVTTAGVLVANHTEEAKDLINVVRETSQMLDTAAKKDQVKFLTENHKGVEDRCERGYAVARAVGDALQAAVKKHTSQDMRLAFVSREQAALGFTSSTFSFNLPSPAGATDEVNAGLAQHFVDLLCAHKEFKPCVSFGQDNGLVYATVPATSTQGAINEEDKAKQAVGGVQLVRISFSPGIDVEKVTKIFEDATAEVYAA